MFEELETVILKRDIAEYGLRAGDMGAVVNTYEDGKTIEVEFVTATGKTVALVTLKSSDVRRVSKNDILHVRGYSII
ncbi:MAG: hypothetical protein US96_C0011G0008 [Candidatus Woesebacteria bacterium GW2011_GWB1_38_5b]|uniref:DUF4926 domain-containing protein n=1 Tax=Candidatus Woesebacteria bacterium GW2011_GWB1_38_5b TaxID=1618569 RepID=A0A0G0KIQ9_9BACT|nr:MAG: hypothetical protein US96_C0011G0008 [Candidatus Woesebacteria bacterium GW2011_GWB1_38_5b]OGH47337.1 MAG: DUF4926 domain-containing protein [Candidatus Levybacteria bacterium RIFCSPLOWO2_01_FULL_39_10]